MGNTGPKTVPVRRSLAVWAILALAMVVLFYVVILVIAATCAYLPFLVITSSDSPGFQSLVLLLCGVAIAGTLLWSLFPKRDKFEAPGPLLDRASHPKLFSELDDIATALNEPLPTEVYLVPQLNAFVADRGGMMGFGSRRVMGIGLPLISIMTVGEFRAILAHEFAHYYGGDTRLGPWVYNTRMAMVRTIQNMASLSRFMRIAIAMVIYRVVMWVLQGYWKVFFRATQLVSRKQEYRADELACHIAGAPSLASGLKKTHGAEPAFPLYWNTEIAPMLNSGYRPAIAEGFALFVAVPNISSQIQQYLDQELAQSNTDAYNSHPPLRDRIAATQRFPPSHEASSAPASSLFGDLVAEEARLLGMSSSESAVAALKTFAWEDFAAVTLGIWREGHRKHAQLLGDVTAEGIPALLPKLPEIGSRIPDPKGMLLAPEQRTARAVQVLGVALAIALMEAGWPLRLRPGEWYWECGNERINSAALVEDLIAKKISPEEWTQRCQTLKIAGMRLGALAAGELKAVKGSHRFER